MVVIVFGLIKHHSPTVLQRIFKPQNADHSPSQLAIHRHGSYLDRGRSESFSGLWYVSSSSGVATSVSELLYPCYFTLLYLLLVSEIQTLVAHSGGAIVYKSRLASNDVLWTRTCALLCSPLLSLLHYGTPARDYATVALLAQLNDRSTELTLTI